MRDYEHLYSNYDWLYAFLKNPRKSGTWNQNVFWCSPRLNPFKKPQTSMNSDFNDRQSDLQILSVGILKFTTDSRIEVLYEPRSAINLSAGTGFTTRTYSHKAISPQRRGLRRDWEGAQLLLNQLAAFSLVINIFLLPPVLFIEYTH